MTKLLFITVMFLGILQLHAQVPNDSMKSIQLHEVQIKGIKKKIETEMKMAVSVDEFLASSDQFYKERCVCMGTSTQ